MSNTIRKNTTLDIIDGITGNDEKFKALVSYIRQAEDDLGRVRDKCPVTHSAIEDTVKRLEYIIRGSNGNRGGLLSEMDEINERMKNSIQRQEKLEKEFSEFSTTFKVTMAKAAVIMSTAMIILIPVVGKVINLLF